MKFFLNIKERNKRKISILNFPIYEVLDIEKTRIQRFFSGLFYTEKVKSTVKEKKIFKFLGLKVIERIVENDNIEYCLFDKLIFKSSFAKIFYNKYLKKIKFDFDDVYILQANSGEIYLFFAYLVNGILKKNNSNIPLFVATQKYHIDILKLYLPQAKYIFIENLYLKSKSDFWNFKNHNHYLIFSANHFETIEKNIKEKEIGKVHYLKSILDKFSLDINDYTLPDVKISYESKNQAEFKIKKINLNLDKFIILAPEAKTCEELSVDFWQKLANKLSNLGFDIFLNKISDKYNIKNTKTVNLDYQEAYYLAQKAKAVISLRSGFSEFLLPAQIPNITVYTKFRKRKRNAVSVEKSIAGFSMLKMPFVDKDKIREINFDNFKNEDELLEFILCELEKFEIKE